MGKAVGDEAARLLGWSHEPDELCSSPRTSVRVQEGELISQSPVVAVCTLRLIPTHTLRIFCASRVLPLNPGCPGTGCVDQAGVKLTIFLCLQVVRSEVCVQLCPAINNNFLESDVGVQSSPWSHSLSSGLAYRLLVFIDTAF